MAKDYIRIEEFMKYVVSSYKVSDDFNRKPQDHIYYQAEELKDNFGLSMFSVESIIFKWQEYSDSLCANWMMPDRQSVEQVFNVNLTEVSDESL